VGVLRPGHGVLPICRPPRCVIAEGAYRSTSCTTAPVTLRRCPMSRFLTWSWTSKGGSNRADPRSRPGL